jgi:hypothetical protein
MGIRIVHPSRTQRFVDYNERALRLQAMLEILVPQITWNVRHWEMYAQNELTVKPYYEIIEDQKLDGEMRRGRWIVEATLGPVSVSSAIGTKTKADVIASRLIKRIVSQLRKNIPEYPKLAAEESVGEGPL